jgi:hypothetical protein
MFGKLFRKIKMMNDDYYNISEFEMPKIKIRKNKSQVELSRQNETRRIKEPRGKNR